VRLSQEELRDVTSRLVAAQEEERARLARELHDDVTQRLARLAIDAGRAEIGGADAATLRGLREGLVALSEGVHALSYNLHPSILDDLGLVEAVQAECDRVAEQSALSVELVAEGVPVPTPTGAARCLYRVAQEAMRNVVRHAQARRIDVGVRRVRNGLRLTVRDDGVGFDLHVPRTRRTLGLASMRERVRVAGGKLTVESAPGRGTKVTAWVPLEEPS
jgi:signal transduction histidine kinase